jgi:hypothetical protein
MKASTLIALGVAIAAMGIYVANADDAPGAAGMGMLLMIAGVVLGVRAARRRLSKRAGRAAIAVGVVIAAFAAFITHDVTVRAALFLEPKDVPSVAGSAPPPQYVAAIESARELVRRAIVEQNLPGVSVAVGVRPPSADVGVGSTSVALAKEGSVVWAEGFGWRDVETRTPVTPNTRFHIGTAASEVADASARFGLTQTGADAAKEWSPEAIGEEGEDFPPLTLLRHIIWQPLGLMPMEYPLPGERATFYVPRENADPRRGRELMYMRDLACCANGMAFSSTPSDLVRFALAAKYSGSVSGLLAGGFVMSLATRDSGVVIAVTSNMAHANTAALADRIGQAFSGTESSGTAAVRKALLEAPDGKPFELAR